MEINAIKFKKKYPVSVIGKFLIGDSYSDILLNHKAWSVFPFGGVRL